MQQQHNNENAEISFLKFTLYKKAEIRNQYNQVPYLTQDTTWEGDTTTKKHHIQKVCDALHYLLDNLFIRFGSKLFRRIVGIPMGTDCAPLVADLLLFCYESGFMLSLSDNNQADVIKHLTLPQYI